MKLDETAVRDVFRAKKKNYERFPQTQWLGRVKVKLLENHIEQAEIRNGKFEILSDEPSDYGGEDKAPAAMEYFLAGVALCEGAMYAWNAADMEIPLESLEISMKGYLPLAGWLGLDRQKGMSRVEYDVTIKSPENAQRIKELAKRAAERCPALQCLTNPVPVIGRYSLNGQAFELEQDSR